MQNPAAQKFAKTDLAKFEHSWDQLPYLVSRGAEKNFVEFMARLPERFPNKPDDSYFRKLIAKAILFRLSEKIVQAQDYGGYRANIVTYSIAWLSHNTSQRVDLEKIWRQQKLPPELEDAIRLISKYAYNHLIEGAAGGNVTEWAKRDKCWDQFRRAEIEIPPRLLSGMLLASDGVQRTEAPRPKADASAADFAEIRSVNANTWFALSKWAKETGNLQPWQRSLSFSLGRLASGGMEPSLKQLQQGMKVFNEAVRLGFREST
jgi:hypothetical protein